MLDEEPTPSGLVRFPTAHKLTLMAHYKANLACILGRFRAYCYAWNPVSSETAVSR
jgi:uncharacterized protein YbgA (DUF1722 family)